MTRFERILLAVLLRAFPARFRLQFGETMRESFEAACIEYRATGRLSLAMFLARTTIDMARSGLSERWRPTTPVFTGPARGARGRISMMDVTLGLRMLRKHPASAAIAVFALAVGIPVGLAPAHVADAIEAPLPVDEGDRVVLLRYWSTGTARPHPMTSFDYGRLRDGLRSFESIGAARSVAVAVEHGAAVVPVSGAEVSASTFDVLRVAPLVGRTLVASDESAGAPPVAVIGENLWQAVFGGGLDAIGKTVQISGRPHTIVGVMPAAFRFPSRHSLWIPLAGRAVATPTDGDRLTVFGRLADAVSVQAAQQEFAAVADRLFAEHPDVYQHVGAEVTPFALSVFAFRQGGLRSLPEYYIVQLLTFVLLGVACTNVGLLVYARSAMRAVEFAIRSALGASRARIVLQVFTESLVLAAAAAGAGLLVINFLTGYALALMFGSDVLTWPYWVNLGVTWRTVLRAVGLAAVSAAVAGAIPALRVTGRSVQQNLQRSRAGRTGTRFGGFSGALIVVDVAVAVVVIGLAAGLTPKLRQVSSSPDSVGIRADEFLAVAVRLPGASSSARNLRGGDDDPRAAAAALQRVLVESLEAEPGVRAVTVASALPRMDHEIRLIELEEDVPVEGRRADRVRTAMVDVSYFGALGQPILTGRGFNASDVGDDRTAVIVNTTFVERALGGRNPIGRRVRYRPWGDGEPGPWYEIVGVVGPLGMHVLDGNSDQGIYHPAAPGELLPAWLAIHVGPDAAAFAPRLREIASQVAPAAVVGNPVVLDTMFEGDWYLMLGVVWGGTLLVGLLLALAASGLYAIMSFTVAQRTREIGVRIALGAEPLGIVRVVARRAAIQIALGVALGMPVAGRILYGLHRQAGIEHSSFAVAAWTLLPGLGVLAATALVACTAPTLRALQITPTEALRSGGE